MGNYDDLKKYIQEKIDKCEAEMKVCEDLKLHGLRDKEYLYLRTYKKIMKKIEELDEK